MQHKLFLTDLEIRFIYFGEISRSTLLRWRKEKPGFPKPFKIGRKNLTLKSEVIEYVAKVSGKDPKGQCFDFRYDASSPHNITHTREKYSANPESFLVPSI